MQTAHQAMADKPATPQRDDMAAVALDTVLLARTGVAIYGTSPTPSASVLGGASEFGRLCYPSHTLHTVY